MKKELIEHMVQQFLGWRLPEDFHPDGGVTFSPRYHNGTEDGGVHEPVGTNLFTAQQAEVMVLRMLEGFDFLDDASKTFILTDSCMWEANKIAGKRSEHCVEVVDLETGQTRYIASGSHIRFVDGKITEEYTQESYNAQQDELEKTKNDVCSDPLCRGDQDGCLKQHPRP